MSRPLDQKRYTCADYVTRPTDDRLELIDGVPYMMNAWKFNFATLEQNSEKRRMS